MALPARALIVCFHTFVLSLIGTFRVSYGNFNDISCLKSIKESLEDPYGVLLSWNFNNNTEGFICTFEGVDCWHDSENTVLNLRLSDMGLKGQFPQEIEKCESLSGLDLSNNELWGPLPFDIAEKLRFVTSLDLSSNKFSGEIPYSIGNCSYLNVLKLDNNRLTGQIPQQLGLLSRIKVFSVSGNLLSGPVPTFSENASVTVDSYANNEGLCGKPLKSCKLHRMKFDDSFQGGFVIGYVVSLVSAITIFVSYCVPWVHEKRRNNKMIRKKYKRNGSDKASKLPMDFTQEGSKEISMLEKLVTRMSFTDLCKATDNFGQHNIIGSGQMGTVYKATLPNGWFLAVKKIHGFEHLEKHFLSELKILGRLKHVNLVPLLGFCIASKERLLVYKYMSNGSLYNWLHAGGGKAKILEWPLRVKIAIGIARGLAWIHHSCNFHVVHLNISSKCILLDHNFDPKISNFERSMLMNPNSNDSSWSFTADNEFWDWGFLKKDVLSFGIVLLELITGKEPSEATNSSKSFDGSLAKWITHLSNSSSGLCDAIDKSLMGKGYDGDIYQFLRIACNCVQPVPEQRPTMLEVYETLRAVRESYGLADGSEKSVTEIAAPSSSDEI